jgi:hypothetical protein
MYIVTFFFLNKHGKKNLAFKILNIWGPKESSALIFLFNKKIKQQWLMSVFPATEELEIGRITVQGQSGQKVSEAPSQQISQVLCTLQGSQLHRRL